MNKQYPELNKLLVLLVIFAASVTLLLPSACTIEPEINVDEVTVEVDTPDFCGDAGILNPLFCKMVTEKKPSSSSDQDAGKD